MTKNAPLLTVVIPTRHRDDLLALCLDQLAPGKQTLSPDMYEVIVTDDGKESTAEKLVVTRFPWATWVAGPCRGPASNRNNGASHGMAPWLVFTDDDCVPSTGWLQAFVDAIEQNEETNNLPDVLEGRTTCQAGIRSPLECAPINESGGWLWSCNMAVRRSTFQNLKGFDEEFPFAHMEDVDFRERLRGIEAKIQFVPEAVVDHPPRPDGFCDKATAKHESEFLMYYKSGEVGDFRFRCVRMMAMGRVRQFMQHRANPDAKVFLRSLFVEASFILKHAPRWQKKYRERYRGTKPPYTSDLADRLYFR